MEEVVLSNYSVDFVRAAVEYCALVEKAKESGKDAFINDAVKLLPLLYLKISVIPPIEEYYDSLLQVKVTEAMYSEVKDGIEELLGEDNLYLETFHPDIELSDSPVAVKISEDLADIYQDLGNFIFVFKDGKKETMNDSLTECVQNFKDFWGQRLVNALRALHRIKYKEENE